MTNLFVTRAVAARARINREDLLEPPTTNAILGDWHVTLLRLAEQNAFVYMSGRIQFNFIMLEGERITREKLIISMIRGIYMVLELAGFPGHLAERVINQSRSIRLARATDLSLLGILTNCALDYAACIEEDGGLNRCSLERLIVVMNSLPAKRLGFKTPFEETANVVRNLTDRRFN